jgi:uncharacterized membrane protein
MKKLFLAAATLISTVSYSQVVSLNGTSSTYTGANGKMTYKEVFDAEIKVEVSESVNATYEFDLGLQTITYNIDGIIATKSFTSMNYDKKNKIVVFTYNDEGIENTGKRVTLPVTVELNLNPGKENMLMSWFDYEGDGGRGVTMVQDTDGSFSIN